MVKWFYATLPVTDILIQAIRRYYLLVQIDVERQSSGYPL